MPNAAVGSGNTVTRWQYIVVAVVIVVVTSIVAANLNSDITFTAVEGITAFAILFVLSTAVERVVEFVKLILDIVLAWFNKPDTSKSRKIEALTMVRTLSATAASSDATANAAKDAKTASTELLLISSAVAFGISIMLISYCKFSLLAAIGFTDGDEWIGFTVTAFAIMGGSTGVHEILGRIQKQTTT